MKVCNHCGKDLITKTTKDGPNAGRDFYTCSGWDNVAKKPTCPRTWYGFVDGEKSLKPRPDDHAVQSPKRQRTEDAQLADVLLAINNLRHEVADGFREIKALYLGDANPEGEARPMPVPKFGQH